MYKSRQNGSLKNQSAVSQKSLKIGYENSFQTNDSATYAAKHTEEVDAEYSGIRRANHSYLNEEFKNELDSICMSKGTQKQDPKSNQIMHERRSIDATEMTQVTFRRDRGESAKIIYGRM